MDKDQPCAAPFKAGNHILLTDYRPSRSLYANVSDSNKFRYYLQQNATKIMDLDKKLLDERVGCKSEMKWFPAKGELKGYEKE